MEQLLGSTPPTLLSIAFNQTGPHHHTNPLSVGMSVGEASNTQDACTVGTPLLKDEQPLTLSLANGSAEFYSLNRRNTIRK